MATALMKLKKTASMSLWHFTQVGDNIASGHLEAHFSMITLYEVYNLTKL